MSSNYLDSVIVPSDMVRDFMYTSTAMVGQVHDVPVCFGILGLDVFLHNRGAAAITIAFNGQTAITVNAGDVYVLNGVKFWLVEVVAGVLYDFQVFGVKTTTLKRLGLLRNV